MTAMLGEMTEDIDAIVGQVWDAFIHLPVRSVAPDHVAGADPGDWIDGEVRISGAWDGLVAVSCPSHLACRMTMAVVGLAPSSPGDVIDVLGEVANITGGNIKALLPSPTVLSPPTVHAPAPADLVRSGPGVLRLVYDSEGDPFVVTVRPAQPFSAGA
jgi:chemotaxis protein CheX